MSAIPLVGRKSLQPLVPLLLMVFLLAGSTGAPMHDDAGAFLIGARGEAAPRWALTPDTVAVFVTWGTSNMGNQGQPDLCDEPLREPETLASGIDYEWSAWRPTQNGDVVRALDDEIPMFDNRGLSTTGGSMWHALVDDYYEATGHTVLMSGAADGGTGELWQPGRDYWNIGVATIERAMATARDYFDPDDDGDPRVVFGGVLWNAAPGVADSYVGNVLDPTQYYHWPEYRAELDTLLAALGDYLSGNTDPDVRDGRFYFINTLIPGSSDYGDGTDPETEQKFDVALDLEANVCARHPFCSMIQRSVDIKLAQIDPGCGGGNCDGWYASSPSPACNAENVHWGQRGLNLLGHTVGATAAAHGPSGADTPFGWELAVELPQPAEWCTEDDLPCTGVPAVRLDVYDDAGTLVDSTTIRPSLANPDWTADLDGDYADADWDAPWASLSTAFLTLEFIEVGASTQTLRARYVYVPGEIAHGASQTGFFRPDAGAEGGAAYFEVWADTLAASPGPGRVRARSGPVPGGGGAGAFFEETFAASYVVPYNYDHYTSSCDTGMLSLNCPDEAPDFFLARLPLDGDRPDGTERRFVFADEADVVIPTAWGPLAWAVDGLVLSFPQGRRLHVEADLAVSGAVLTAAAAGMTWGGVAVYEPGSLDLAGVTVTAAEVGIEVNSDGNVFDDVLLDENGVGILTGYACVRGGECLPARSDFRLSASCVTNSVFDDELGLEGYGIWARHADALVWGSTVSGNGAYGLFLDDADVTPYLLRLQDNGADPTSNALDGVHVLAGGDLRLTILYSAPPSGENLIESNAGVELFVDLNGYATVGLPTGGVPRNHLARGALNQDLIINNATGNDTLQAVATYWGTGGAPPSGSIQGPVSTLLPLTASPSGAAGHPDDCVSAGAAGGTSLLRGPSLLRGGGTPDPAPRVIDPETATWFAARVDSLRAALAEDDDDAGLARALYATQRLDRADDLGEHEATMGLLAALRGRLTGGGPLTAAERAASEAALVAAVHDALRAVRLDEAHALLSPFVSGSSPLPEVEGAGARHALALALAALDEASGEVASALARIEAVLAELGGGAGGGAGFGGGEDPPLVRDLEATAALLARRRGGAGAGGREGGPTVVRAGASGLPAAYALGLPYPNPSTGLTAVPFALPEEARVEVSVYDLLGRRVAVLADASYGAGRHVAALDGRGLASGVYVVRAVMASTSGSGAETRSFTRRITLTR